MKTKQEAEAAGRVMLAHLGGEWKIEVFENCGWYVYAKNGPLSISAHEDGKGGFTYHSSLSTDHRYGCTDAFWYKLPFKTYTDPIECARDQVNLAREFVNKVSDTLRQAQAAVENFACPCCKRKYE